jgi:ATP adenylyltransferase
LSYIRGETAPQPAPLPAEHFLPEAEQSCFLCQAAAAPPVEDPRDADRQRLIVSRAKHTVTVLNRYPYNTGHLLIAPRLHKASLELLSDAEQLEISHALRDTTQLLKRVIQPEGFNLGLNLGRVAGAGVPGHLHWHIVPRWNGDANFMTVTADARVISQSLDELWLLLTTALQEQP